MKNKKKRTILIVVMVILIASAIGGYFAVKYIKSIKEHVKFKEIAVQLQQGVVLLRHHLKFFDTAVCTNLLGGSADTYSHGYLTVFQTDTQVLLQPGNHRSKLFCNDFIIHDGFERGGVQQSF